MRAAANDSDRVSREAPAKPSAKRPVASRRPADLIPLYDIEQFLFLVERERARADRAAARPKKAPRQRPTQVLATVGETKGGQPKPSSDGVWGATTDNREFSLVVFRPRSRSDRAGLVDLLQCCVRTTDAVGVIDTRRLGVLLPDTASGNALLFVKKVLALAEEQSVFLSHIVHTYPAAWPDEESPLWHEPKRKSEEETAEPAAMIQSAPRAQRQAIDRGVMRGLMNWLQAAAFRRPMRRPIRASA